MNNSYLNLIDTFRNRKEDFYIGIGSTEYIVIKKRENDPLLSFTPDMEYDVPTKFVGFEAFRDAPVGAEFTVKHAHNRKITVTYTEEPNSKITEAFESLFNCDATVEYTLESKNEFMQRLLTDESA